VETFKGGGRERFAEPVRSFLATDIQFHCQDEFGVRIILTSQSGRVTVYEPPEAKEAVRRVVQSNDSGGNRRQTRLWEDPEWTQEAEVPLSTWKTASPTGSKTTKEGGLGCEGDALEVLGSPSSAPVRLRRPRRPSVPSLEPLAPRRRRPSPSSVPSRSTSRKKAGRSTTKTR